MKPKILFYLVLVLGGGLWIAFISSARFSNWLFERQQNPDRPAVIYAAAEGTWAKKLKTPWADTKVVLYRSNGQIVQLNAKQAVYTDPHEAETEPEAKQFFDRTTAWLKAVETADMKDVESASQFALAAYQASQMEIAQRWINRAGDEPVAQWLQAKLFMRAGKIAEAAKLLAKLSRKFPQELPGTNAPASFSQSLYVTVNNDWNDSIPIGRQVFGELGVLHLARREYTEALDALLRSGYPYPSPMAHAEPCGGRVR